MFAPIRVSLCSYVDKRGKDGILTHTDPKGDMPEDADTPAPTVTPTDA